MGEDMFLGNMSTAEKSLTTSLFTNKVFTEVEFLFIDGNNGICASRVNTLPVSIPSYTNGRTTIVRPVIGRLSLLLWAVGMSPKIVFRPTDMALLTI